MKTTSNIKSEIICFYCLDFPQILKFSLCDQTKLKNVSNEDDLQRKMTTNSKSEISQ